MGFRDSLAHGPAPDILNLRRTSPLRTAVSSITAGAEDDSSGPRDLDADQLRAPEQHGSHLRRLRPVGLVDPDDWPHVVYEKMTARSQRGDRVLQPLPLAALGVGEDQIEAGGVAPKVQFPVAPSGRG